MEGEVIKRIIFQNPQNAADFIGILPEDLVKRDAVTEVGPCFECCKNVVAKGKERWLKEFQNYPEVNISTCPEKSHFMGFAQKYY